MPFLERDGASIYYEEFGAGYPVLLFAPGALESCVDFWHRPTMLFDPTIVLAPHFRLIAMDQRNAGRSRAPISAEDGWHTYTQDHVALLDHLGIERAHVLGWCIGGPFLMSLVKAQPRRVSAAVAVQPSGRVGPLTRRSGLFDRWCEALKDHPEATPVVLDRFHENLYTADFVYSVPREFIPSCQVPLLVLAGNDEAHPFEVAEELARLAPNAEFIAEWKEGPPLDAAVKRIREFLLTHVPATG